MKIWIFVLSLMGLSSLINIGAMHESAHQAPDIMNASRHDDLNRLKQENVTPIIKEHKVSDQI